MKSSYTARTGHPRTRFIKKNDGASKTKRRISALSRLKSQLETGTKRKEDDIIPLEPHDIIRIKNEIHKLESKTSLLSKSK